MGSAALPSSDAKYPYYVTDTPPRIKDEDLEFLSAYTGEPVSEALREHVLSVWRTTTSKLWVYKCIQELMFLKPRLLNHPFYPRVVEAVLRAKELGQQLQYVEVGCCFGQDTRKLILDGYPAENVVAIDIVPDYWDMGFTLFKDRDRLHVKAIFGSLTDPAFVWGPAAHAAGLGRGNAAFVFAGAVLHVLSKEDVEALVRNAYALLGEGGVFYGDCVGSEAAGEWWNTPDGKRKRYLHSVESLTALLQEAGFADVEVQSRVPVWQHTDKEKEAAEKVGLGDVPNFAAKYLAFTAGK